jgi:hypothetical protein
MNFQEQQQEKLENTQFEYAENAKLAVIYNDPITNRPVHLLGSAYMTMSMHEYAKLRVPDGVQYNVVTFESAPNEVLPGLNFNAYSDKSLNMFYRYLNAL